MGRGARTDYCRIVSRTKDGHPVDTFLACDLDSKGGYSYWFRSPTQKEGLPVMEIPYSKKLSEGSFDSYCGVVAPTPKSPARTHCLSVAGLGFGSGGVPDPNPPERVRTRLRAYENLIFWIPMIGNESSGLLKDRVKGINFSVDPISKPEEGIVFSGGAPTMKSLSPIPMNETSAISLMIKPNKRASSGSNEMLLFNGDDSNLNEISIQKTFENEILFSLYEGKAETFSLRRGRIVPGEWNHIVIQYHNGYWHMFLNGRKIGRQQGPRHSFMKRHTFLIGKPLGKHISKGFIGSIADVRFYSRSLDKTGIRSIKDDFHTSMLELKAERTR